MISKIIAFGCSHTFGMGLKDCYLGEEQKFKAPDTPSEFAWPNLLAKKFETECDNQSIPGGSNYEILHKIIDYDYRPSNVVVVGWTTPQRDILKNNNGDTRIAVYALDDNVKLDTLLTGKPEFDVKQVNRKYFEVHSEYDMIYKSWLCQYTAALRLKSKNIPFHFSTAWGWKNILHPFESYICIENFIDEYKQQNKLTAALDGLHIGELTHKIHARNVFNELKNIL